MRGLLDSNILIALLDRDHQHREIARRWMRDNARLGWATCPIVENGCARIMSQPRYPNPLPARRVAERLRRMAGDGFHRFWPDDISLLAPGVVDWARVAGPRQITDVYLLALAVARKGRLVTLDTRVAADAVIGADRRSLCVVR